MVFVKSDGLTFDGCGFAPFSLVFFASVHVSLKNMVSHLGLRTNGICSHYLVPILFWLRQGICLQPDELRLREIIAETRGADQGWS